MGNDDLGSTRLGPADASEANDTEAETERLENSPQKVFRRKTLVSASPFRVLSNGLSPVTVENLPANDANTGRSEVLNYVFLAN